MAREARPAKQFISKKSLHRDEIPPAQAERFCALVGIMFSSSMQRELEFEIVISDEARKETAHASFAKCAYLVFASISSRDITLIPSISLSTKTCTW